jgi:Tol biopolymer transport system component
MTRGSRLWLTAAVGLAAALLFGGDVSQPARAAFPGLPGKLAVVGTGGILVGSPGGAFDSLTNTIDPVSSPGWSPDGKRIAFATTGAGDMDVFVMNEDGSDLTNLTNSAGFDGWPAWSPDGKKLVFTSNYYGQFTLFTMDADGKNRAKLTTQAGDAYEPNWGTNGRIVFTSDVDGDSEIYSMKPDGTDVKQLTSNSASDRWPNVAPLDGRIVYASNEGGGDYELYVMNADGSGKQQLTNNTVDDTEPTWSPLGLEIAWARGPYGATHVYVAKVGAFDVEQAYPGVADQPDWGPSHASFVPDVSKVKVSAGGFAADVEFDQAEPAHTTRVELWEGKKGDPGSKVHFQIASSSSLKNHWNVTVKNLKPWTSYELYIQAFNASGEAIKPTYKHPALVTTLRRDVTVHLLWANVIYDADDALGNCGDFAFDFQVGGAWARVTGNGVPAEICDSSKEDWTPLAFTQLVAKGVGDELQVKMMAVDYDYGPGLPKCGTWGYGGAKCFDTWYDWSEGATTINFDPTYGASPSDAADVGEVTAKGGKGDPKVTWHFEYNVHFVKP